MSKLISLGGKLGKGHYAIVDDIDYEEFSSYEWHLSSSGYARRIDRSRWRENVSEIIFLHKVVANATKGQQIDHINRNKLDNRRCNLRLCNSSENMQNRKKHHIKSNSIYASKYTGVKRHGKKWLSRIHKDNRCIHIGLYVTEEEAALAYNQKALELFGENAYVNNIGGSSLNTNNQASHSRIATESTDKVS